MKKWIFFAILALAGIASARWFIVGIPGGGGVQLQNSTTLEITQTTLTADQQDANSLVLTVRLRVQ